MANQNVTQLTQQTTSANTSSLFYAVTGGTTDTGLPFSVLVNNLGLTGTPTAPTATGGTNTTQIATTAFVQTTVGAYAPLASPTFTGTVTIPTVAISAGTITGTSISGSTGSFTTITASGLISPTSTIGIKGTATNDSTSAGSIGEFQTATTSGTSLTTGTVANATSVSLTAGDWDVDGVVRFNGTSVVATAFISGVNTTSATLPSFGLNGYAQQGSFGGSAATTGGFAVVAPTTRISLSATTTVYLIGEAFFSSGTVTCDGLIRARRVR